MRTTLWTACLMLSAFALVPNAQAQDAEPLKPFDLEGVVTDSAGTPLVGVFVALVGSDWGSVSDEDGKFDVEDVYPGELSLTAELLGYEVLEWEGGVTEGDNLSLTLVARPLFLERLAAVTERFNRRSSSTSRPVRIFEFGQLATTNSRTVLTFLHSRGGLLKVQCSRSFTTECISVHGRVVEPEVWVDESRVVGGLSSFRVTEPHELYMLEIYSSGRHIRAYTNFFMERAAVMDLQPSPLIF